MKKGGLIILLIFSLFLLLPSLTKAESQCSEGYLNNYKCSENVLQREYQTRTCQKVWKNFEDCSTKNVCPMTGNTFHQYSCVTSFLGLGTSSCQREQLTCPDNMKCAVWGCAPKEKGYCKDGTEYGKCSTKTLKGLGKPKFCQNGNLIDKCQVCGCEQGDCSSNGKCSVKSTAVITNKPPVVISPKPIYLTTSSENLQNIIELPLYASDPESQPLDFSFKDANQFASEIIDCTMEDFKISCQKPKQDGKVIIPIIVSDGKDSSEMSIEIEILPVNAFGDQGEIIAQGVNTPPRANAGQDQTGYPNQRIILDGSASYDKDNDIPMEPSAYEWYYNKNILGNGRIIQTQFPAPGEYTVFLKVKDTKGAFSTDKVIITITPKQKCKNTQTSHFPMDTLCTNKWPSNEGDKININSPSLTCDLFEVCDDSLDYIIEDAITCCKDQKASTENKQSACNYALKYSRSSPKKCYALYIIQSLGGNAIYMGDYFEAEMCCYGEAGLCRDPSNLFKPKPMPYTRFDLSNMKCFDSKDSRDNGKWLSDTKLELNNIALSDIPTHASLNILGTGTCVDYSASVTTLLRKAGYRKDEIYTVESPTHAYNLVKFPYEKKYTVVDTTGNNNPAVVFGKTPGEGSFDYCSDIKKCYNDNGLTVCPSQQDIYGCENVKVGIARKAYYLVLKAQKTVGSAVNIMKEAV